MFPLKTSVRSEYGFPFQGIQELYRIYYIIYEDNPFLLLEFNNAISKTCTFVCDCKSGEI